MGLGFRVLGFGRGLRRVSQGPQGLHSKGKTPNCAYEQRPLITGAKTGNDMGSKVPPGKTPNSHPSKTFECLSPVVSCGWCKDARCVCVGVRSPDLPYLSTYL